MDYKDFEKAKEDASSALNNIARRGSMLEAVTIKKYIKLLEMWNDKMIKELESSKCSTPST